MLKFALSYSFIRGFWLQFTDLKQNGLFFIHRLFCIQNSFICILRNAHRWFMHIWDCRYNYPFLFSPPHFFLFTGAGRIRVNSESHASTVSRDEELQARGEEEAGTPTDGAPFRGRSKSAPPALWAAKKYGRQLRRMSDEFDTLLDKGVRKTGWLVVEFKRLAKGKRAFLTCPQKGKWEEIGSFLQLIIHNLSFFLTGNEEDKECWVGQTDVPLS